MAEDVNEFLLLDEIKIKEKNSKDAENLKNAKIIINDVNFAWDTSMDYTLQNIRLNFDDKNLYILAGPVGSGKSTLLKTIIHELPPSSGKIATLGEISYTSQEPCLFPGNIRENIMFGLHFDTERYEQVISVCALEDDFANLPNGDKSTVGERGSKLSGGQCARINLARAIYRQADIYLIDDALASVDAHVGRHIFDNCIRDLLRDKIRIFVTNDVRYFKEAAEVIFINNGKVEFQGSYSNFIITKYYTPQASLTEDTLQSKLIESKNVNEKNDSELPLTSNTEIKIDKDKKLLLVNNLTFRYLKLGGSMLTISSLVLCLLLAQAFISTTDYWLAHWMNGKEKQDYTKSYFSLYVYGVLLLISVIIWTSSSLLFYKVFLNASKNLHNQSLASLLKAPVCFFESNPSGKILNRFSRNIGLVDETLPTVTLDALHVLLMMTGVTVQVLIINWYSIVPLAVMGVICWKFKNIYLPTAQRIKRLEMQAKSPVFSHVNSTVSGLSIIRSFQARQRFDSEFCALQDSHTSIHYLNIVSSSAFGFWLDIVSISLLALIIFGLILTNNAMSPGVVGLAISQILMLYGSVQYGLRQATEMITQTVSVERVFEFTNIEKEGPFETECNIKLKNWPSEGKIEFKNLTLRYLDDQEPVLKNITLNIEPSEKVGIVGRTGAGKTSLVSALFRLTNFEGSIFIDQVNINTIGLYDLRKNISILPQNPILFTKSVRDNLDPEQKYDDQTLWEVLENTELKELFFSLDSIIENRGNNLSAGEKQLICLARAMLAKNKILILDEAAANIDYNTYEIIQEIIKRKFSDCTVVTIAHRLSTVLNSDKILVMKQGEVIDYDSPAELMQCENGYLYKLINT